MRQGVAKYTVYIVRCSDGTLYTGITLDIERRLREHNGHIRGGAKYTRAKGPVELVYTELCNDRSDAARREYQIKHMTRIEKEALIQKAP